MGNRAVARFEQAFHRGLEPRPGRLLAAVSGGADSVAMLTALVRAGVESEVVHCNFHLRGGESDRDASFVRNLCEKLGVGLTIVDFDAASVARKRKISIEMACRDLRYEAFAQLRADLGCEFVCVAHTADDNIETMLLNMLRGSGLRGLAGMRRRSSGILRPMLELGRRDVEEYLAALGQDFITDSSNLSDDYRRNFIRNTLLPEIESRWPGARKALRRTQENLREQEAMLENAVNEGSLSISGERPTDTCDGIYLLSRDVMQAAPSLPTAVLTFIRPFGGNRSQSVEIADSFKAGRLSSVWPLGEGREAILAREGLIVRQPSSTSLHEEETVVRCERVEVTPSLIAEIKSMRRPDTLYICETPTDGWRWRRPKVGDRIESLGMKGSQLVSDVVKDAHLGELEKRRLKLLIDDSDRIVWIPGLKRSRHYLADFSAPTILRISSQK